MHRQQTAQTLPNVQQKLTIHRVRSARNGTATWLVIGWCSNSRCTPHPSHVCVSIILALFHQICTGCSFFPSFWCFSPENVFPHWFFTKNVRAIHFRFEFSPKTYASFISALGFHQKRMGYSFPLCFFAQNVCKTRFRFGF